MAGLASLVVKCALLMLVLCKLGEVEGMPAVADDYEAVEVGGEF